MLEPVRARELAERVDGGVVAVRGRACSHPGDFSLNCCEPVLN